MKALTLHQPWASLIVRGYKRLETRSWAPPKKLIGDRIAIHAAQHVDIDRAIEFWWELGIDRAPWAARAMPRGVIVCTAKLAGAYRVASVYGDGQWRSYEMVPGSADHYGMQSKIDDYGDFSPGRWLWRLDDVIREKPPIPAKGRQRLWEWEEVGHG